MRLFELKKYADSRLPLAVMFVNWPKITEEHCHDCIEMLFVTGGSGICVINSRRYPMLRGDLYVMNRGDVQTLLPDEHFLYWNIMLDNQLFSEEELRGLSAFPSFLSWSDERNRGGKSFTFDNDACNRLEEFCRRISAELRRQPPGFELAAKALMLEFLLDILRSVDVPGSRPAAVALPESVELSEDNRTLVSRTIDLLQRNYTGKLRLSALARQVGASTSHLSTVFRREVGTTIGDYRRRIRIEKARTMLDAGKLTVSEISDQLGFCDVAHFSKSFSACTGVSPTRYQSIDRSR